MANKEDLKILQKCYDMIEYGYIALRQYPKSERHTLAAETKRSMYELLRLIIRGNKRYFKKTTLQDIDIELENMSYLIRLSNNFGFLSFIQYDNLSRSLNKLDNIITSRVISIYIKIL